jgi:peptidoglycan/xylan/chitin deacetylase (PgdA/CDA1 family)
MKRIALIGLCLAAGMVPALAETCPGNPDAIGTSRTITVNPASLPQIGTLQYPTTLPLEDHEVALTFDDGPLPPWSNHILDTLKANCVKATYFLVGSMAHAYPSVVRRIYNEGHTIGTHSQNHPFGFERLPLAREEQEVTMGIASVQAALGDPKALSPFFRVPGLGRTKGIDQFLASHSITVWSTDTSADDWHRGITPAMIVKLAISRLDSKNHRGVLLLHDIHPATALALPVLLKELKAHGYHIVQVVAPGERPASLPEPTTTAKAEKPAFPAVVKTSAPADKPAAAAPAVAKTSVTPLPAMHTLRARVKTIFANKHHPAAAPAKGSQNGSTDYAAMALDQRNKSF